MHSAGENRGYTRVFMMLRSNKHLPSYDVVTSAFMLLAASHNPILAMPWRRQHSHAIGLLPIGVLPAHVSCEIYLQCACSH
jgi:hypothetical protein